MNPELNQPSDRDESAPAAGSAHPPVGLFIALALLLFWGMGYLDSRGGGFQATVYAPYKSFRDLDADQPRSGEGPNLRRGQQIFKDYCSVCHGESGQGNPATGFPPLAGSEWVTSEGHNRLVRIVLNSVRGPITVKGQQFNLDSMPPWREVLTNDADLSALISFLRSNKEWGHNASFVTPEQVTQIREQTKDRTTQWTAEELLQIPDKD